MCEIQFYSSFKNEDNNKAPPTENVVMQVNSRFYYKLQKRKFLTVMKIRRLPREFYLNGAASVPTAQIIYEKL